jgi:hypothetical protein
MGEIKPLGSEKLRNDEKLKRILELTYFNQPKTSSAVNENRNGVEYTKETNNGVYGIVKEYNSYYVKRGLNEGTLDYIGGMFMKNKNKFTSYGEALKRLELISSEELNEATKYVLKQKKSVEDIQPPAPGDGKPLPSQYPTEDQPPVDEPPVDEPSSDMGVESDSTLGIGDETEPSLDEPSTDMGGETEEMGKPSDYMSEVQKFSGKLGQSLRDVKSKMESDDIKYVINMILSAVDINKLNNDDKEDISGRFEPSIDNFDSEENSEPSTDSVDDVELDEIMNKLSQFVDSSSDYETEDEDMSKVDMSKYDMTNQKEKEPVDEVEIDLDEIKKEIGNSIGNTLSKYFK